MSEIQNDVITYEDEIDLRELFMAMWRNKYIIISMALVLALLTGLFSMFVLSPVYQAKLDIIINMPATYQTRFGDYTLPINSNDQYIDLITSNGVLINTIEDMGYDDKVSVEDLRDSISIVQEGSANADKPNIFQISVSADNPEEALILAQTLFDNYIEFVDVMTKERAINHYYNHYSVSLLSLEKSLTRNQELLAKNELLLANTEQTINQKEVLEKTEGVLSNSVDFVVLDNIINQNYFEIEKDIIEIKQTIYSLENSISTTEEYLSQLEVERDNIAKYLTNRNAEENPTQLIGVVETSIYLSSQPVAPSRKTSPSNSRNAVIGLIIGLMLGLATAYVREFWLKKE
jgi:capsular polysaccharide biosynthesis protein